MADPIRKFEHCYFAGIGKLFAYSVPIARTIFRYRDAMVMICDWQRDPGLDVGRLSFSVVCFYSNGWESFYDLCK